MLLGVTPTSLPQNPVGTCQKHHASGLIPDLQSHKPWAVPCSLCFLSCPILSKFRLTQLKGQRSQLHMVQSVPLGPEHPGDGTKWQMMDTFDLVVVSLQVPFVGVNINMYLIFYVR